MSQYISIRNYQPVTESFFNFELRGAFLSFVIPYIFGSPLAETKFSCIATFPPVN